MYSENINRPSYVWVVEGLQKDINNLLAELDKYVNDPNNFFCFINAHNVSPNLLAKLNNICN